MNLPLEGRKESPGLNQEANDSKINRTCHMIGDPNMINLPPEMGNGDDGDPQCQDFAA